MPARPAPPSTFSRSSSLPARPAPPAPYGTGRARPAPPTGRRRFDWLRASIDPYGYGRNPYGPAGFATQAELGNVSGFNQYGYMGPVGYGGNYTGAPGGGTQVVYQDVYDDDGGGPDDADMGCDPNLPAALPMVQPTAMTSVQESGVHRDTSMGSGAHTGSNIGWEPAPPAPRWEHPRRPSAPEVWNRPAPPRERPAPPTLPWWEQLFGRPPGLGFGTMFGDPRFGIGTIIPASGIKKPTSTVQPTVQPTASSVSDAGQDASFGWMMPTLPGAISDSPLRGVFAPDEGLGGRHMMGMMG
jgi:hypothetical protein